MEKLNLRSVCLSAADAFFLDIFGASAISGQNKKAKSGLRQRRRGFAFQWKCLLMARRPHENAKDGRRL